MSFKLPNGNFYDDPKVSIDVSYDDDKIIPSFIIDKSKTNLHVNYEYILDQIHLFNKSMII